ncbi:hypothetical protein HQN64_01210 [Enterobacteriaceae bacterium BIT-l23]|uniref:hypothetical protein n=1 Tax=Jejubacter sp. L23 TaxID=3092086 RepID=UPI0015857F6E|nr:hypothetical protein [Enterobacteriaceae bacterium BIT-l23]
MKLNNSKKTIWTLFFICFLMCIALIMIGSFSYLLKGWLSWEFDKPFPFGKAEVITILKISLLGIPTGLVFWVFDIR